MWIVAVHFIVFRRSFDGFESLEIWGMKIYQLFTASTTEGFARALCANMNPFGALWFGFVGFYQERGWWMVRPKDSYVPGQEICLDISEDELVMYGLERNLICSDGVGDLVVWGYAGDGVRIYSIARYLGLARRVGEECFVLPRS